MSRPINTQRNNFELDLERTNDTTFEEDVVCSKCMGYGSAALKNSFMVYGDKIKNINENENENDTCNYCNGTGKLIKQIKVKFEPFDYKLALKTQILRNPENLI